MDEILYSRQTPLNLKPLSSAVVVGLGGTGSWVSLFLAMSGCPVLDLMDFDYLEVSNFNRLPLPMKEYLGKGKAEAMKEFIEKLRPDCMVRTYGRANPFTLATTDGEILFDCTDAQTTQKTLHDWCKDNSRQYIRVGYNGTHITVTDHAPTWHVGREITGYTVIPSWVVPAVFAACIGVSKALYCPETIISKDLNEIGGKNGE